MELLLLEIDGYLEEKEEGPQPTKAAPDDFKFQSFPLCSSTPTGSFVKVVEINLPAQILKLALFLDQSKDSKWEFEPEKFVRVSMTMDSATKAIFCFHGNEMVRWEGWDENTKKGEIRPLYCATAERCPGLARSLAPGTRAGPHKMDISLFVEGCEVKKIRFTSYDHDNCRKGSVDIQTGRRVTTPVEAVAFAPSDRVQYRFGYVQSMSLVTALRTVASPFALRSDWENESIVFSTVVGENGSSDRSVQCESAVKMSSCNTMPIFTNVIYASVSISAIVRLCRTQARVVVGIPADPESMPLYLGVHIGPCSDHNTFSASASHSFAHIYLYPGTLRSLALTVATRSRGSKRRHPN